MDPTSLAYVERRTAQGRTSKEIRRCLKRYLARRVYRQINAAGLTPPPKPSPRGLDQQRTFKRPPRAPTRHRTRISLPHQLHHPIPARHRRLQTRTTPSSAMSLQTVAEAESCDCLSRRSTRVVRARRSAGRVTVAEVDDGFVHNRVAGSAVSPDDYTGSGDGGQCREDGRTERPNARDDGRGSEAESRERVVHEAADGGDARPRAPSQAGRLEGRWRVRLVSEGVNVQC
jgi:hypothetical protein